MTEKIIKTTTGKLKISIPDELSEVSLGQLAALQEKAELNDLEAISILSGIPATDLLDVKNTGEFQIFTENINKISRQILHLFNVGSVPEKITLSSGRTLNVPADLGKEPAGAFMAAKDIIGDEISQFIKQFGEDELDKQYNPSVNTCCHILAHYFYCKATGKTYDEYKAEEFTEEIKNLRVTEALPVARHFFYYYPALSKPKTSFSQRPLRPLKERRGYKLSKNLNTSILSTRLQTAI